MSIVNSEEIKELYVALINRYCNAHYETIRAHLIYRYGYNQFRDMQKKAFEMIFTGVTHE